MSAIYDFKAQLLVVPPTFAGGGSALALGTNLFVGKWPTAPDNAVRLSSTPSPGPQRVMGVGTLSVVHYNTMVQVVVRSSTYTTAETMMRAIIALMDNFVGTISGTEYKHIGLAMGPFDLGEDENNRFQFSASFHMRGGAA